MIRVLIEHVKGKKVEMQNRRETTSDSFEVEQDDTQRVTHLQMTIAEFKALLNYSPTLTYPKLVYDVIYGFMNSLLGFTSQHQIDCLAISATYFNDLTVSVPQMILTKDV